MKLNYKPLAFAVITAMTLSACGGAEDESNNKNNSNDNNTDKVGYLPIVSEVKIKEPKSGFSSSTTTVELSEQLDEDVTFNYTIESSSAINGTDFSASSGEGLIKKGARTFQIPFEILGDNIDENDESFTIKIHNASL